MLKVLHIENIAVIERCDIEFHEGFNVLTGETGAGKSIVIDALGAVLGMRTPRDLVRTGEARALVSAIFEKLSATTYDWLRNNGFESEDDTVFIQREISAEGKNSCRLNGRPATVAMLKELGVTLLNIHGQHDSQELMHTDMHAEYIERFASCAEYNDAWSRYCRLFLKLHSLQTEKKSLITDEAEKARREDLLRYQIDELTDADLAENELETLVERRIVLRNATKVLDTLEYLTGLFYGSDEVSGICADLGGAERALFQMPDEVSEIKELAARVADIKYGAEDIASELRAQLEGFDASPAEIERVETRYDLLKNLSRKYGETIDEMIAFLENAKSELAAIEYSDKRELELELEIKKCSALAWECANELFDMRSAAARDFESRVLSELAQLDMAKVRFNAHVSKSEVLSTRGCDNIEFLIATNAGEPLKPLSKIASGGELARIMLALKNVLAEKDDVETLVFDEVDAGVSGRAAQKVAVKLAHLATFKQILCVTHLAQMSAMADTHFKIEKSDRDNKTYTSVTPLDVNGRIDELARIIGGQVITNITKESAKELITSAQEIKKEFLKR